MAYTEVTESQVRLRLEQITEQIDKLSLSLSLLNKERQELEDVIDFFERFQRRLARHGGDIAALAQEADAETGAIGRPTVPEMIVEALKQVSDLDLPGLEPKAMLTLVKSNYWPEAEQASVGPVAWRMWKEGRIKKAGSRYYLLEDEAPAGAIAS